MRILVTGSNGLIGSEAVRYFDGLGHEVVGLDNNMRAMFFGSKGDTTWNLERLKSTTRLFKHYSIDIRDQQAVNELFAAGRFDAVLHCAAQPSHDKAREFPILDFEVNAVGTLHLLEATRTYCPEAVFILMSTNKVYGDAPNELPLIELPTRWDYAREQDYYGVDEHCRIDQSLHSLFGTSKAAADLLTQEYARTFGLKTGVFRGGCLTGPAHSGVELHGFLSYLVKAAVERFPYRVFGYKAKQVRDQIHRHDVVRAAEEFVLQPRPGEVYNLGGGRENNASMLELIDMVQQASGCPIEWTYEEENRLGDHICYISDIRKLRSAFPSWNISVDLPKIVDEMVSSALLAATS